MLVHIYIYIYIYIKNGLAVKKARHCIIKYGYIFY